MRADQCALCRGLGLGLGYTCTVLLSLNGALPSIITELHYGAEAGRGGWGAWDVCVRGQQEDSIERPRPSISLTRLWKSLLDTFGGKRRLVRVSATARRVQRLDAIVFVRVRSCGGKGGTAGSAVVPVVVFSEGGVSSRGRGMQFRLSVEEDKTTTGGVCFLFSTSS